MKRIFAIMVMCCGLFSAPYAIAGGETLSSVVYSDASMSKSDIVTDACYSIKRGDWIFQDAGPSAVMPDGYIPDMPPIYLRSSFEAILGSYITHCGLIVKDGHDPDTGQPILKVLESPGGIMLDENGVPVMTPTGPIPITGMTPVADWIQRGAGCEFIVCRPTLNPCQIIRRAQIKRIEKRAKRWIGKPYDFAFSLANDQVYCSELIWSSYFQITGTFPCAATKLGDLNMDSPISQVFFAAFFGVDDNGAPSRPAFRELVGLTSLINSDACTMVMRYGLEDPAVPSLE